MLLILKSYWFDKPRFVNEGKLLHTTSTHSLGAQPNATITDHQLPPEPVLEVVLQSEIDLATELPPEPVLEVLLQSETADVEPIGHGKVQKLWGPSGPGKKFKSINKLCKLMDSEPSSGKKSGWKKQKK